MIKTRKYVAVLGAAMFCVVCMSLYMMLETMSNAQGNHLVRTLNFACILPRKSWLLPKKPTSDYHASHLTLTSNF